jgi:NitT/TauT family transport system permease protein
MSVREKILPVTVVVLAIIAIWYAGTVYLNAPFARDMAAKDGKELSFSELVSVTMHQERPVLPSPHQVFAEWYKTTFEMKPTSKRSLVYHSWVTISATLLGFAMGTVLGIVLAVGVVFNRAMDKSLMPWVIASQTIPILAIAPMIIVVLNAIGISGLLPKAVISTYLSFFPVVVGMVKGLRSPERIQLDLMHTYNASSWQTLTKLRWPASIPYLFASLKVAIASSLVGAIVGELPTGAVEGLGARLLSGSYYGQTAQIWAALLMASAVAAILVMLVGVAEKVTAVAMGARPAGVRP